MALASVVDDGDAVCTERDQHALDAALTEDLGRCVGARRVGDFDTREQCRFRFIGHQDVDLRPDVLGQRRRRAGVEQDRNTGRVCDLDGALDNRHRDFELEDEHRRAADTHRMGVDVGGRQRAIGAGRQHDAVLADVLDEDHGDAGACRRRPLNAAHVDAVGGESVAQRSAESVVADLPDHADLGAEAGAGDGLVGALAAG